MRESGEDRRRLEESEGGREGGREGGEGRGGRGGESHFKIINITDGQTCIVATVPIRSPFLWLSSRRYRKKHNVHRHLKILT